MARTLAQWRQATMCSATPAWELSNTSSCLTCVEIEEVSVEPEKSSKSLFLTFKLLFLFYVGFASERKIPHQFNHIINDFNELTNFKTKIYSSHFKLKSTFYFSLAIVTIHVLPSFEINKLNSTKYDIHLNKFFGCRFFETPHT